MPHSPVGIPEYRRKAILRGRTRIRHTRPRIPVHTAISRPVLVVESRDKCNTCRHCNTHPVINKIPNWSIVVKKGIFYFFFVFVASPSIHSRCLQEDCDEEGDRVRDLEAEHGTLPVWNRDRARECCIPKFCELRNCVHILRESRAAMHIVKSTYTPHQSTNSSTILYNSSYLSHKSTFYFFTLISHYLCNFALS